MNWDYIAGLFEKGSQIGFNVEGKPIIKCTSSSYGFLEEIKEFVGYGRVTGPYKNKSLYIFSIYKRDEQKKFLETIKDRMILKKVDVVKLLDYFIQHPIRKYIPRIGRINTIKCGKCKKFLSPDKFSKNSGSFVNCQGYCKDCSKEYYKEHH